MPCSSPRSSGWRATDWIIEPKMLPMPTPAPRAPRPTPSARPTALPAFVTSPVGARMYPSMRFLLVLRLDRGADVDGGQGSEDEGLDADDDHDLEDVEDRGDRNDKDREDERLQDEDEADEREDQDVARQHVREKTDAERDEAH